MEFGTIRSASVRRGDAIMTKVKPIVGVGLVTVVIVVVAEFITISRMLAIKKRVKRHG